MASSAPPDNSWVTWQCLDSGRAGPVAPPWLRSHAGCWAGGPSSAGPAPSRGPVAWVSSRTLAFAQGGSRLREPSFEAGRPFQGRPGQAQCPSHWDPLSHAVKDESRFEEGCHPAPLLEDPRRQGGGIRRRRRVSTQGQQPLCNATCSPQPWLQSVDRWMDQPPRDAAAPPGPHPSPPS